MRPQYLRKQSTHRQTMTNYYGAQARIYDATRWIFLYGRERLIQQLNIQPGERVVEIGCGTGKNFDLIQQCLQGTGELIGVDCSTPMLCKAAQRIRQNGWRNVRLLDMEYGREPVTRGRADVVVFSYSWSMIQEWELALACAHSDLWPGGRIGVVDFRKSANSSKWFAEWLALNHVNVSRPYEEQLRKAFEQSTHMRFDAWAGLWSFYLFVGARAAFTTNATA